MSCEWKVCYSCNQNCSVKLFLLLNLFFLLLLLLLLLLFHLFLLLQQILGGYLISGSSNGTVCLWSMRSHEPMLAEKFQAHTESLMDIYVLDTNTFLTIGMNQEHSGSAVHPSIEQVTNPISGDVGLSTDLPSSTTAATTATGETVDSLSSELSRFSFTSDHNPTSTTTTFSSSSSSSFPSMSSGTQSTASLWVFGQPVQCIKTLDNLGSILCTAYHQQPMFGNRFLATGQKNGTVKVYNVPSFSVASEIQFSDIKELDCCFVALNLSRDKENTHYVNMKNPFRDLILTTSWSDGRVMVCQIDTRKGSSP